MCGTVHTRSMWMVERHLKSLKALVRQRAHLEGSMVEGYMVYQTLVYISDYLPHLGRKINMHCILGVNNIKISKVEVLVKNGKIRKVKGIIFFFFIYIVFPQFILYIHQLLLFIFLTNLHFFIAAGRVWDALHLYIANNLYWMKLLMEQCEQYDGRLSWEGVATLIKRAHHNEDHNITQTKIDLAYGLKDK
jgi:hypothetical protein